MAIRYGDSDTSVFLGGQQVSDVRLGDVSLLSLGPFTLDDGTVIELPTQPIPIPNLQINPPKSGTITGLSKDKADLLEKLGLGALLAGLSIPIVVPCDGDNFLPTRQEIVNAFNEFTQIPLQIEEKLLEMKADLEQKATDIQKDIENFDPKEDITALALEELEPVFAIIEEIEELIDDISEIISPYWKKGDVRDVQKEADDAWNELIQEYHIFIPVKILEMISKVIPISFNVNIMGIDIDVLKIMEDEEQERVYKQILDEVDKYYQLIPEPLRFWDGEWGTRVDEFKAKCTWQHVKAEITKWLTNTLFEAFKTLIKVFKEIWEALGLPDIPVPLDFDVEGFIKQQMDGIKEKAETEVKRLEGQVESIQKKIEGTEDFDAKEKLQKELEDIDIEGTLYGMVIDELKEVTLFGKSLIEIVGGDIEETVRSAEGEIDRLIKSVREWFNNWQQHLLFAWIKEIKKFLDKIGLGKIFDLLLLTFCDVLKLIGIPLEFKIEPPALPV